MKCAIGALIVKYYRIYETGVYTLSRLHRELFPDLSLLLLASLRTVHDGYEIKDWPSQLEKIENDLIEGKYD